MSVSEQERIARATLSRLAEPGDAELGRAVREHGPAATLRRIRDGRLRAREASRWQARLPFADGQRELTASEELGLRQVCPGEPEWPTQLDDLADEQPHLLWVKGADLRFACLRSVTVVGARAATSYGAHVAGEVAALLAERGWSVLSGGAYGIDGAAHRGALAVDGTTVAVLPCGLDLAYPRGHAGLFAQIARAGVLVSEWPPGATPTRPGFLVRNRVIAALSRGTVIVEAAARSGALNTARHAERLCRSVMAVPGPVTSTMSAGCHLMLREWRAVCVSGASEIIEQVGELGADPAAPQHGPAIPREALDETAGRVLEAVPVRGGSGPAEVAAAAGVSLDTVLRCLGELAAGGFAERCEQGWRLARPAR